MIQKNNTNKCICSLWGIRDEYYLNDIDPEILSYEQYHFFPKYNDCNDNLEPVCYGVGEANCVCEDVKNLGCDCDGVYKRCPDGYTCEKGCTDDKNNTDDCGKDSNFPCLGTCRKIPGQTSTRSREEACNCYIDNSTWPFGPRPTDGICGDNYVCINNNYNQEFECRDYPPFGESYDTTPYWLPTIIPTEMPDSGPSNPSYPLNFGFSEDLLLIIGFKVIPDGQNHIARQLENTGITFQQDDACHNGNIVYLFEIYGPDAGFFSMLLDEHHGVSDFSNPVWWFREEDDGPFISIFSENVSPYGNTQDSFPLDNPFTKHWSGDWYKIYNGSTYEIAVCTDQTINDWESANPDLPLTWEGGGTGGIIPEGTGWIQTELYFAIRAHQPNAYDSSMGMPYDFWVEYFMDAVTPNWEELWNNNEGLFCTIPHILSTGCHGQCVHIDEVPEYRGCMDEEAYNFDADALWTWQDDCVYGLPGCTDPTACNYNPDATIENGTCTYNRWCEDTDGDGFGCPTLDVYSCENPNPIIYVEDCTGDCDDCASTYDDCGVCGGDNSSCSGCTDSGACNYDNNATIDDGSCAYVGDVGYECNCDGSAQVEYFPDADGDGIGCCTLNGLNQGVWYCENPGAGWSTTCGESNQYCECPENTHDIDLCGVCYNTNEPAPNDCLGCTNPYADNYHLSSTIDDGSCTYHWDDTIYLKMFYWSDTGFCDDPYGICNYNTFGGGGGGVPDLPPSERITYTVPFPLTEADCNPDYIEDLLNIDRVISTDWTYDPEVEQPECDVDNAYRTIIHMYPDGSFATSLTGDNSFCPGVWSYNFNQDQIQFTYRSGTTFTIGEGKYIEMFNDDLLDPKYTELSDCVGEDIDLDDYHIITSDGSLGVTVEQMGPGQLMKQSCANAYGGLAINYFTVPGPLCPSIHIPTNNIRRREECIYNGGDLEISTPFTFDDLVNGFHGNRYRNTVEDNILPYLFEKGNYYVRKWDFHPMIKGAPDGTFVDRIWSIDLYTEQFDGTSIKSLPVYESDRSWHSMNGNSAGEYEINSHTFKMTYKNATDDSCCFPGVAVYKPSSPLIGGGLVCESYDDNLIIPNDASSHHEFPGCKTVLSAMQVDVQDYANESRKYLSSNTYPGQYKIKPQNVFNRKWEYIYKIGEVLRGVYVGRCDDTSDTNLWLNGESSTHNDYAAIPEKSCIDETRLNDADSILNLRDLNVFIKYLAKELDIKLHKRFNMESTIKQIIKYLSKFSKQKYKISSIIDANTFDSYHVIYKAEEIIRILNFTLRKMKKFKNNNKITKTSFQNLKHNELLSDEQLLNSINEILLNKRKK